MNKQYKIAESNAAASDALVGLRVLTFSGGLLIVLAVGGWYMYSWLFARSVLVGGLLVNGSFWLLKSDIQRLMQRVAEAIEHGDAAFSSEKAQFFLRFYARLVVVGLLLFVLASKVAIDVIGLTLGLATVMLSVVIIGLSTGRCWMPSKV